MAPAAILNFREMLIWATHDTGIWITKSTMAYRQLIDIWISIILFYFNANRRERLNGQTWSDIMAIDLAYTAFPHNAFSRTLITSFQKVLRRTSSSWVAGDFLGFDSSVSNGVTRKREFPIISSFKWFSITSCIWRKSVDLANSSPLSSVIPQRDPRINQVHQRICA